MRVIGGKFKGKNLVSFSGEEIRPTSDKARESLFDILQFKIAGTRFLDLFCGTGAVGIEALSRGAAEVKLNDFSAKSLIVAKKNLTIINNPPEISTYNFDAETFLSRGDGLYDVIFMDPPYKFDGAERVIQFAIKKLSDNGVIVYESETPLAISVAGAVIVDERKYGRARLTFIKKGE